MNTVAVISSLATTIEPQKEIFKCNTSDGPVMQEVIIWTIGIDSSANTSSSSTYAVDTCQKLQQLILGYRC
jgi:hypothetical protein